LNLNPEILAVVHPQAQSLQLIFIEATIMADSQTPQQRPLLTQEQLKKRFEIKNFDLNAILRGAQLTVVGGMCLVRVEYRETTHMHYSPSCPEKPSVVHL
jgi:hypothetical protein